MNSSHLLSEIRKLQDNNQRATALTLLDTIDYAFLGKNDLYRYLDSLIVNSYQDEPTCLKAMDSLQKLYSENSLVREVMKENHLHITNNLSSYYQKLGFTTLFKRPTVAILCFSPGLVWSDSTQGLTGSEEAVVYASRELVKRGYQVIIFGNPEVNNLWFENPLYLNYQYLQRLSNESRPFDIQLIWRNFDSSQNYKFAKANFVWPHDLISKQNFTEEGLSGLSNILWLSEFHRQAAAASTGCNRLLDYKAVCGNGVLSEQFSERVERKPFACIYASNYVRGLEVLLGLWPSIKSEFPEAELDIYYGWNTWSRVSEEWLKSMKLKIVNLERLGVREHGLVDHKTLARAFQKASFWLYPCTFPETFCITALKAQIAGAIPVVNTTGAGAVNETVQFGFKSEKEGDSWNSYLDNVKVAMRTPSSNLDEVRSSMKRWVEENHLWKNVVDRWESVFNKTDK